jgi:uncharacterized damage-inducible protein DinB
VTEIERITDQLKRAFEGDAWHGPALTEVLADVTAVQAAARPLPKAHRIWEIVLHIAAWERFVLRAMRGEVVKLTPEEDWPLVTDTSETSWRLALGDLRHGHLELRAALETMLESRLNELVPGREFSLYFLLHGVIQHDLYHAGQIALLKKA